MRVSQLSSAIPNPPVPCPGHTPTVTERTLLSAYPATHPVCPFYPVTLSFFLLSSSHFFFIIFLRFLFVPRRRINTSPLPKETSNKKILIRIEISNVSVNEGKNTSRINVSPPKFLASCSPCKHGRETILSLYINEAL